MPEGSVYDVFISYSHRDQEWVRGELLPRLEGAGLKVCIDSRDFRLGAPSVTEMERAVLESRRTLLVLTPAYIQSDWTAFENLMLQTGDPVNRNLSLIPLLKERCEIPRRLGIFTYADFTQGEDWDRLLTALGAAPRKDPSVPARTDWNLVHPYGMPPNFTGRLAERRMLSDWLEGDGPALFVLRALGGFGKSALVWHWLLHDVEPVRWPRVVWWCFYEMDASFDRFLGSTLRYFGVDSKSLGPREQVEEILTALRRSGTLLVLDGFERELRAFSGMGAAYQEDLEEVAPDGRDRDCVSPLAEVFFRSVVSLPDLKGRVLLTTRLLPRVLETRSGELLAGCREQILFELDPRDALEFFYTVGIQGDRTEIMEACEKYGYHPLSLRLLAGLVLRDLQQPRNIAAAQKLDVSGNLVQRKHHVLEQSYASLTSSQKRILSRIACFRGAVSYDAVIAAAANSKSSGKLAAALGNTSPTKIDEELIDLTSVRGLLHFDEQSRRFDLHPIVRRYAYDRLGRGEQRDAHSTLRDYFAAVPLPEKIQTLGDLSPVIELYHHMVRADEYEAACELFRDRLHDMVYHRLGAYELCIDLLRSLFPYGEDSLPRLKFASSQAWTLNEIANSYSLSGQSRRAIPLYKKQLSIYEEQHDVISIAIGLGNLADDQLKIGELRSAEESIIQKINRCQGINVSKEEAILMKFQYHQGVDEFEEMIGCQELARLLAFRGEWDEAENLLKKALELFEERQALQFQVVAWAYQSLLCLFLARTGVKGRASKAVTAAQQSLELAEKITRTDNSNPRAHVRSYWLLGAAYREIRDFLSAERYLSDALTQCRRIHMVDHEVDVLIELGRLRTKAGDRPEARRIAEEALMVTDRCGYSLKGADIHLLLAQLDIDENRLATAREHAAAARRLATCDGPPDYTYKVAYDEAGALLERLKG